MRPGKRRDFIAGYVCGVLTVFAAIGLLNSPVAKADESTSRAFAWEVGPQICMYLDEHPTFAGIITSGKAVMEQGFTVEEAGEVVGYSITDVCPRHTDLLARFIVVFGPRQVA